MSHGLMILMCENQMSILFYLKIRVSIKRDIRSKKSTSRSHPTQASMEKKHNNDARSMVTVRSNRYMVKGVSAVIIQSYGISGLHRSGCSFFKTDVI